MKISGVVLLLGLAILAFSIGPQSFRFWQNAEFRDSFIQRPHAALPATLDAPVSARHNPHSYYTFILAQPELAASRPLRNPQAVREAGLATTSRNYNPSLWDYDPTEDAARMTWQPFDASITTGEQLRWGSPTSYRSASSTPYGQLGGGTQFYVWEVMLDDDWVRAPEGTRIPENKRNNHISNHKAFQFAANGDELTLEPRFRYWNTYRFPGPNGAKGEICGTDVRTYIGGSDGAADRLGGIMASPLLQGMRWARMFAFLDGATGEFSFWIARQDEQPVQMYERQGGFANLAQFREIDTFYVEFNSSQEGGTGIPYPTYFWVRNWAVLNDLSYARAKSLVDQNQW